MMPEVEYHCSRSYCYNRKLALVRLGFLRIRMSQLRPHIQNQLQAGVVKMNPNHVKKLSPFQNIGVKKSDWEYHEGNVTVLDSKRITYVKITEDGNKGYTDIGQVDELHIKPAYKDNITVSSEYFKLLSNFDGNVTIGKTVDGLFKAHGTVDGTDVVVYIAPIITEND